MILEIIFALFIGILCGTFTGLAPGIHINLVAGITLANLSLLSGISPIAVAVFIVALSITHTFIDFIPSIFLGAPDEDTILSVLPGHKLLKQGLGYQAALLTLEGALSALLIGLVCIPIYLLFLDSVQNVISKAIPYLLIFISIYIIFRERKILLALFVFCLAGILGFLAFNLPVKDPLLPLLTGLFGSAGIITSISSNENIPPQKITNKIVLLQKRKYFSSIAIASIIGPLFSFLPGIGSSHIAVASSEIVKHNSKQFLFLNGLASTLAMFLSFIALYVIGKTRTGSAAAIKELLEKISSFDLALIVLTAIVSGIIAFFIGKYLAKKASTLLSNINYKYFNLIVLGILLIVNLFLTNWIGWIVLITSTSLGVFTISSGVKRINLMGALILPTILYYLV